MEKYPEFINEIKAGAIDRVREMLDQDAGLIEARDENGVSALLIAVYYGQAEIVELLLELNTDLDIWEAAATGRLERIDELLDQDSSLVNQFSADGFTPLGLAAFFGHKQVLNELITHGADVNIASNNSMKVCPLHSAVAHYNAPVAFQMAKSLLEHGAKVNAVQMGGWTPLHEAAARGEVDLVKLLLQYGADKDMKNEDGTTALDLARKNSHDLVADLL
jgi:ankyrin repeat protein